MGFDRSESEQSRDGDYWSIVAEFIDRRDRGESVDPAEFAAGDPLLAKRLQECLAGFGWLEHALSGSEGGDGVARDAPMPQSIGEYSILREIGRGGMGVVYEAVHQSLGRRVALKVLFDPTLRGKAARERFQREARTAASLHHTNIVPVFDVGTADGHLYFAMQLIEGGSLEELAGDSRGSSDPSGEAGAQPNADRAPGTSGTQPARPTLDPHKVARLGLQAAEALAYAHARGIVHRDIKPSNLILDSSGTLWVTDFGLARRIEDPPVTATGARVGTPRYMSPEQATAQWNSLDARTDVYSLGVTMYELLTGRPLFSDRTPHQLLVQVIRSEPARPRRLNPRIPRDLETIVLKAMAKRPADRYRSAQELAEDLRRFLAHEPVRARRIGPLGRTIRWCQREPIVAAVSICSLALLATIAAAYQVNLTGQRDAAIAAREVAREQLAEALFQRARVLRRSQETGRRWVALDLLKRSADIRLTPELSSEAAGALQLFDVRPTDELHGIAEPATAVAIDSNSKKIAIAQSSRDQFEVAVWDRVSQSVLHRLAAPTTIQYLAFSGDGRRLAGSTDRHICLWDLEDGHLRILPGAPSGLSGLAFSPDGHLLFGFAQGLCVWDLTTGEQRTKLLDVDVEIGHVAVCCGGRILAAAVATQEGSSTEILRWSLPDLVALEPCRLRDRQPDPLAEAMGILALAASPTGNVLAASYGDSRIRLWDARTGKQMGICEGHRVPPVSIAFTPDGDMVVSSDGFQVKLWDTGGSELATLIPSSSAEIGPLPGLAVGHDGLIVTSGDRCQAWELATPKFYRVLARQSDSVKQIVTSTDGRRIAWITDGQLRVLDWPEGNAQKDIAANLRGETALGFVPNSHRIVAVGTGNRRVRVWDGDSGELLSHWDAEPASTFATNPMAPEIAIAHSDGVIRIWNTSSGHIIGSLVGHRGLITCIAYSPDGKWLVAGNQQADGPESKTINLWDLATGKLSRSWLAHPVSTYDVAFSPDSTGIFSCGADHRVTIWDTVTGERIASLTGSAQPVRGIVLSPDGSMVAARSVDERAFLWDCGSGKVLAELSSRACGSLSSLAFSSDGSWLFAGGGPYRWTHTGPGSLEAWNLEELRGELSQIGLAWRPEPSDGESSTTIVSTGGD